MSTTAKPWSVDGKYTKITLKYDLYVSNVGYVAHKGDVLNVSFVREGSPYVAIPGWDDVTFFVHPTLIYTVQ